MTVDLNLMVEKTWYNERCILYLYMYIVYTDVLMRCDKY